MLPDITAVSGRFVTENAPINTKKGPAGGPGILTLTGGELDSCLPKHPDVLLHRKPFPLHPNLLSVSDPAITLTQNLDQFLGVWPFGGGKFMWPRPSPWLESTRVYSGGDDKHIFIDREAYREVRSST